MIPKDTLDLARKVRVHAIKMVNHTGASHIGSILSMADILAVLYGRVLNYRPNNPRWDGRDRFILSKGHASAGIYAVLAESGFIEFSDLKLFYKDGSHYSGHVSHIGIPGVELSTGSLGHGVSVAAGMVLAGKIDQKKHRVFTLISDGELNEGSTWEAILFAAHQRLEKLTVVIDRNRLQATKATEEVLTLEPLADKLRAFGWCVLEVNGHDHSELYSALQSNSDKPIIIIANTIKGKGVSFMENSIEWHYRTPIGELFEQAMKELGENC
jgi:transketolase